MIWDTLKPGWLKRGLDSVRADVNRCVHRSAMLAHAFTIVPLCEHMQAAAKANPSASLISCTKCFPTALP